MNLFERIQNKILIEQSTGSTGEKQRTKSGPDFSDTSSETAKKKKTKYQQLRDQRTKYNVLKNKKGEYVPSIQSAKAKIGERIRNITQPPDPKATRSNALNASPGRIRKLNKAQRRAARFEPGAGKERFGKKFDKDYGTRILDRITKNQEANIDTSRKGLVQRTQARIDAKSPTIISRVTGKKIPMPGAPNEVDFKTGGRGINQKGVRTDKAVINRMMGSRSSDEGPVSKNEINRARRQQTEYDKAIKNLKSKSKVDKPVLGSKSFNLQTAYDDLKINLGGKTRRKRAKNQPTFAQVKAQIDKKYPVKMGKTGLIPDKSTGAYGSANDRVAVSADKKTRIKAPNYDELIKKNKKKIKNIVKSKPSTSGLYDPFKNKIPKLDPLKPLRIPKLKPSVVTKTATKTKLFPKLMKAASRNPKTALAVGLLGLGTYGAIKNRTAVKNMKKNNLLPAVRGGGNTITTKDRDIDLYLQTDSSRK